MPPRQRAPRAPHRPSVSLCGTAYLFRDGSQHLLKARDAARCLVDTVLKHGEHTLFLGLCLYRVGGCLVKDNFADSRGDRKNLMNADPTLVALLARALGWAIEWNLIE